jgi:hypothetical protein
MHLDFLARTVIKRPACDYGSPSITVFNVWSGKNLNCVMTLSASNVLIDVLDESSRKFSQKVSIQFRRLHNFIALKTMSNVAAERTRKLQVKIIR